MRVSAFNPSQRVWAGHSEVDQVLPYSLLVRDSLLR